MKYILAFDPGGTTGWALGSYDDNTPLTFLDGGQIADGVVGFSNWLRAHFGPSFIEIDTAHRILQNHHLLEVQIVSESFHVRPGVPDPDVTPLRIEGALTALLGSDVVVYQQPSTKALVPDSTLKSNGLWIKGQRHQMDARIHALAYMRKQRHMPTLQAYWSNGEQA